jgi:hypothetical protein
LCACEMLLPNCGPLPQISHTCAIVLLQILGVFARPLPGSRETSTALHDTPPRSREAGRKTVFSRRMPSARIGAPFLRPAEYSV